MPTVFDGKRNVRFPNRKKKESKDVKKGNPGVFLEGWRDGEGVNGGAFTLCIPFYAYENVIVSAHHKFAPWVSF